MSESGRRRVSVHHIAEVRRVQSQGFRSGELSVAPVGGRISVGWKPYTYGAHGLALSLTRAQAHVLIDQLTDLLDEDDDGTEPGTGVDVVGDGRP